MLVEQLHHPTFWVAVAFAIFVGLLVWKKVPALIGAALDKRADDIRNQLEEARRLREEAQALLAGYERNQRDAEKEAENIVTLAKAEAERAAADAKAALEAMVERRTQQAGDKIAQAEARAIKQVRATAADVAIRVAKRLIAENLDPARARELTDQAIAELDQTPH
ncbi:MAG: F0F1 ATP synthase subunit B [Sphingomonadales bacterium]